MKEIIGVRFRPMVRFISFHRETMMLSVDNLLS